VFKKYVSSRGEGRIDAYLNQTISDENQYLKIH
jgi:hypothetical protein